MTPDGPARHPPLRVLVVDDSASSRGTLARILARAPGLVVVGTAIDGEDALREVARLEPDVVVLDLQMPRMDGFTFLRLLMDRKPTPVIVASSLSRKADVFKALELGALDFVPKPEHPDGLQAFREDLLEKCATVRALRIENLAARARPVLAPAGPAAGDPPVAVIGASAGGPQAVRTLLAALPGNVPLAGLVAVHMPERFTGAFAERLARFTPFTVQEARDGDLVAPGRILVAPGGHDVELRREPGPRETIRAAVWPRDPLAPGAPRHCPSVDRLFASAAAAVGPRLCAVVLTGMGRDGSEGIVAVKRAGGLTLAEAEETAVVYGMPGAAVATGAVDEVLGLHALAARLAAFARGAG